MHDGGYVPTSTGMLAKIVDAKLRMWVIPRHANDWRLDQLFVLCSSAGPL